MSGVRGLLFGVIGLAVLLAAPTALAQHGHGSGPTSARGTVPLGPAGSGSEVVSLSLEGIGILVYSGDSFQYAWAVENGSGPSVRFEVYAHGASHVVYVNTTAIGASSTWQVTGDGPYFVSWSNPATTPVNVTYSFQGIPPLDPTLILAIGALFMLGISAYVVVSLRRIRRESGDRSYKKPDRAATEPVGDHASDGPSKENSP